MVTLLDKPAETAAPPRTLGGRRAKIAWIAALILVLAGVLGYVSIVPALMAGEWSTVMGLIPHALATLAIAGGYAAAMAFGMEEPG
jgi:protein-S-isoprenylcysteine O-methyltransferase Ste14